jgi:NADH-quinone oxidoreductase subunit M
VGEFLPLMGVFKVNTWVAVVATSGVVLSAAYALWLYRRVVFGDLVRDGLKSITDMSGRERAIFAPLVVGTILLGVYPSLLTDLMSPTVSDLIGHVETAQADWAAAHAFAEAETMQTGE